MSQGKTPKGGGLQGSKGSFQGIFHPERPFRPCNPPQGSFPETSLTVHSVHISFLSLGFSCFLNHWCCCACLFVLHHVPQELVCPLMSINAHFDGLSLLDVSRPNAIKPQKFWNLNHCFRLLWFHEKFEIGTFLQSIYQNYLKVPIRKCKCDIINYLVQLYETH